MTKWNEKEAEGKSKDWHWCSRVYYIHGFKVLKVNL
jgi:hypothetical protein